MNIQFFTNLSEKNAVNKNITQLFDFNGTLREESSVIDPVITVTGLTNLPSINYAYIPEFGRYYFITNIKCVRNNYFQVSMHVDVLMTYKSQILANSAIIERNEIEYDLKINDGLFKTQQNPRIAQFEFPNGFTNWDFVLAVAGN